MEIMLLLGLQPIYGRDATAQHDTCTAHSRLGHFAVRFHTSY